MFRAVFVLGLVVALAACGESADTSESQTSLGTGTQSAAKNADSPSPDAASPAPAGPAQKPGGGLVAEKSGIDGTIALTIRWSAEIVSGIPAEGLLTQVFKHTTQLVCPVKSSGEAPFSYFGIIDNPNASDPFAATGSYQQWLNEECTGSLSIEDSYHQDDPTIAGPEPIIRISGTRPLSTGDAPHTIETDLNKARTRYLFIAPNADGFQQHEAPDNPGKLVKASAAPMATLDFTLEGPIGGGKREIAVQGGMVYVDWTFTRGRTRP